MTEQLVGKLGYVGIALILVLGGLGLPIPEEAPIILAAILTRNGQMSGVLAFSTCLGGVLLGDFVVYFLGYFFGERVLSLPLTRRLLTKPRETQIKGYFHRHGFRILILGRFAVGFRTAAYLTAGILKLPPLRLFLTDLVAALLSTSLMFGLGYLFAHHIEKGIHDFQQWAAIALAVGIGGWLSHRYYKAHQRAGLPVGPPVLVDDEHPLPPDDLSTDEAGDSPAAEPPPSSELVGPPAPTSPRENRERTEPKAAVPEAIASPKPPLSAPPPPPPSGAPKSRSAGDSPSLSRSRIER